MYALIRHKQFGAEAEIMSAGSEASMLDRWEATEAGTGWFYSVRPVDHDLTRMAADQMADRLTVKQRAILQALVKSTAPGQGIKPGSRKRDSTDPRRFAQACRSRGFSIDSSDVPPFARKLAAAGLLSIEGLNYAPKTYRPTTLGRIVGTVVGSE